MNEDPAQAVEAQMRLLRVRYLEKMAATVDALNVGLLQCQQPDAFDAEAREAVRCAAHKLAGTGATYGFPDISVYGRRIDDELKADLMVTASVLVPMLRDLITACTEAMASMAPVQQTSGFGRRPSQAAGAPAPQSNLPTMLVVDDDETIRTLFLDMFASDARIMTAVDTDQALKLMRLHQPEIVLLDDIMPDCITGLTLLEDIQKTAEFPNTAIIMVTASDSDADRMRGLYAGAADYITKPFEPHIVAKRVRAIMHQTHA